MVEHIVEAERLGYERAWLYDSPALYGDIWVFAALAAERTSRIGLGPAVLVPNLRHPLAQASAIATLEQLAPGRIVVAIGTGFTGRMAMGQKRAHVGVHAPYIEQVRALLRGEKVEVDGAIVQMLHAPDFAPPFPITTPIIVAANGPKGLEVADELGDGVMTIGGGDPTSTGARCSRSAPCSTTASRRGFASARSRPRARRSPSCTTRCTKAIRRRSTRCPAAPSGASSSRSSRRTSGTSRCTRTTSCASPTATAPLLDGDLLHGVHVDRHADRGPRTRLDALEAAGATEILYAPMGPDVAASSRTSGRRATPSRAYDSPSTSGIVREAEQPLGDDVAQHLAGAAADR